MLPRNKHNWLKILSYATLVAGFLMILSTPFAHAISNPISGAISSFGDAILNIGYTVIGKAVFAISYILAMLAGIGIAIEAWLIGMVLNINAGVFSSPEVQQGFAVTLSIANLGFVLGIIIIAIATILHRETYGYKKLLWKLVVAAILVNFSLVIAAPIFNLGNSMTTYFLNCVDPTAGGCAGTNNGVNSMNDFASTLAGAFNPQKSLISINNINGNGTAAATLGASTFANTGQDIGKLIVPIFSMVFVFFELAIIVIVLAVFFIQLLVRYIYIAILAILMPFAWLGWVFPSMGKWWSSWWDKFIKQTFFAPIVVFFIYLAIKTAQFMSSATTNGAQSFATYTSNSNVAWAAISNLLTNIASPIVQSFLNIIVLAGLTIGGMFVADRMGIALSKAAQNTTKSFSQKVGNYAWGKTKRIAGDRLRSAGRQTNGHGETTTALQRFGAQLQGIPGLRKVGAIASTTGSTEALHHDKEAEIKKFTEENLKNLSDEGLARRAAADGFLDQMESAAIGQEVAKRHLNSNPAFATQITPALMNRYVETMGAMGNLKNEETLKSLDNTQLIGAATSHNAFITDIQAASIAQEIAKRNLLGDPAITPTLMAEFVAAARRVGKTQEILNNRPNLVEPRPGEAPDQALIRAVRGIKDIVQIDHRMLDLASATANHLNPDEIMNVALHLSSSQINKIASDGNAQQQDNLRQSIIKIADDYTAGRITLNADQQAQINRILDLYTHNPLLQRI